MGPDFSVLINLRDRFTAPLKGMRRQADEFERAGIKPRISLQGQSQFTSALGKMKGAIAAAGIAAAFTLGTKAIFEQTSALEQNRIAFQVMMQDVERGNKLVAQIQEFAAVTPFDSQGLGDNARLLLNFGVAADKLLPTLKILGDVSGGNQARFDGLSLAFAQVASTGRLMGQDLLQMINSGFNPLKIISEETGKSMRQLKSEMEKGNISFELVENAFKKVTEEGGQFYNMMDKQSQTLGGRFSTLRDNFNLFLSDIGTRGSSVFGTFIDMASDGMEFIRTNTEGVAKAFAPLGRILQPVINVFRDIGKELGFSTDMAGNLRMVFNGIGSFFEFITPVVKPFFQIMAEGLSLAWKLVMQIWKTFTDPGFGAGLIRGLLGSLSELAKGVVKVLGGVGDLVGGIFNFDLKQIRAGLSSLISGTVQGTIGTAVKGVTGAMDGFRGGIKGKDFFGAGGPAREKALSPEDLKAGASQDFNKLLGGSQEAAAKEKLRRGISSVTGDARSSRNITVNITKLVEQLNVTVQNSIKESERDISRAVQETLLRALRDAEAAVG